MAIRHRESDPGDAWSGDAFGPGATGRFGVLRRAAATVAAALLALALAAPSAAAASGDDSAAASSTDDTTPPAATQATQNAAAQSAVAPQAALAWSGTFTWTAAPPETDVNNDYSIVTMTVSPTPPTGLYVSVYDEAGTRVCNSSSRTPSTCTFTSRPPADGAKVYRAYMADNFPNPGPPTAGVVGSSTTLTVANVGWKGEIVTFEPVTVTDDYQIVLAKVAPATAGGYLLSVYRSDGVRVCVSSGSSPDSCSFTSRPTQGNPLVYTLYVAKTAPSSGPPPNPRLVSDPLTVKKPGPDFIYVALGDSFQSGEGAGSRIPDQASYLSLAYENGTNYPGQVGTQSNTLVNALGGNGCHRSLENYAKLNRDLLEPGADVLLIDVTCSGTEIEPSSKPAIVGNFGVGLSPYGQVFQALSALQAQGYTAADVDLITVGMGGNDAGFGRIVSTCLGPVIVRRLIDEYPNPPGELTFIADHLASCSNVDLFADADAEIDTLQEKEQWAQGQLLTAFPNAQILQLNYPDILPDPADAPALCGGVSRTDLPLLEDRFARINEAVAASVTATNNPRLKLVDVSDIFGANPLCPGAGTTAVAAGFNDANLSAEVDRLLNVDGTGDQAARSLMDAMVASYTAYKLCLANDANPFDGHDCALGRSWDDLVAKYNALDAYISDADNTAVFFANLAGQPGPLAQSQDVRYDRSRGFFHPNELGHQAMACVVRATYQGSGAAGGGCAPATTSTAPDTIGGLAFSFTPFVLSIGQSIKASVGGFDAGAVVSLAFHSEKVDLGTATAGADGRVAFNVAVPNVAPGVHKLTVTGVGSDGIEVVKEFLIEVPGDPVAGTTYGVYLCCSLPQGDDAGVTLIDVEVQGATFTMVPDPAGGVLVQVPLPPDSTDVDVTLTNRTTGEATTETIHSVNPDALQFGGWGRGLTEPPGVNTAKAGSDVPIVFRVLDADGRPVRDPRVIAVRTQAFQCQTGEALGVEVPAASAGRSGLAYAGNGWWIFGWKTDRSMADTCQTLSVLIDHGGRYDLDYSFATPGRGGGFGYGCHGRSHGLRGRH